jgi:Fuc2NAc and GlcNAc transferase
MDTSRIVLRRNSANRRVVQGTAAIDGPQVELTSSECIDDMTFSVWLLTLACALLSALLTGAVRRFLLTRNQLAIPNERSSHAVPTPQGGGIAIVAASAIAVATLAALRTVPHDVLIALVGGSLVVAVVGFADDRYDVSAKVRFAVHCAAALWALIWLGGLPSLPVGEGSYSLGIAGYFVGVLGIVWSLNLFNFMDGIDGIAASEAVFVALAGAFLSMYLDVSGSVSAIALILGGACAGFLIWNWPPAKIFMGDVGSGYIGYLIALMALVAARDNHVAWLVWLVLGGVFFVDATTTLVRRFVGRERLFEAHRSHAYQRLAIRWGHRAVTVSVLLVNVFWLLPCAWLVASFPSEAPWIAAVALAPLVVVAIRVGRNDPQPLSRKA